MDKTKNTNTFRFKSFADRVNEIDIRRLALYHIGHQNEELPEENETYFHQTLKKWVVLNLTDEYSYFSRKCMKVVTLPQLIHQKDFVVDLLLERLSTATNLSLQPLLELLYVLARDLREEFYPYFQRALDRLICLLNTDNAEELEWTFVCLAHLFKTLKLYLKKNIGVVFHAILPLLDEQRYEEHVTNFAVECFAFIARDVKDFGKFLDYVLDTVASEQVESVQGCGRLLFEILRGVKGQFHSIAGDFLQFIFESLVDENRRSDEKSQMLCDIVSQAVNEILKFMEPNNMSIFWTKLSAVANAVKSTAKLGHLIAIFILAAQFRSGRYLAELDVVVPTILRMFDNCMQASEQRPLELLPVLVSKILLSSSAQVTQLDASRLLRKALTIAQRDIYDNFVLSITAHTQFELLILPAVISYFEKHFDLKAFELMARIVLKKQPLSGNASDLKNWKAYAIHIRGEETLKLIEAKLEQLNFDGVKNVEEQLLLLILIPHLIPLDKQRFAAVLEEQTLQLANALTASHNGQQTLLTLSLLIETQIHLNFAFTKNILRKTVHALLPLVTNLRALGCLDQLLAQNAALFKGDVNISSQLVPLLGSHNHDVRLTTAHCLRTLHKSEQRCSPYAICFAAECITPTVHTYREQLLQLQKLEIGGELFKSFKSDAYKKDVLRFLLGMLYHNFKFVWEPVLKLIEEYAKVLTTEDFWVIYKEKLQETAELIDYDSKETEVVDMSTEECWQSEALNQLLITAEIAKLTQQELQNYRNLLWMRLSHFGQIAEVKNRDLVTIFLKFVEEEYKTHLENRELSWNLIQQSEEPRIDEIDDDDDDADNDDGDGGERDYDEEAQAEAKPKKSKRKRKVKQNSTAKHILQTLQSKLGIFVGQANPKALYREPQLYSFYMDMLAGPNAQLQKLALDCVMAYKSKAIMPYKEHLYAIIDERKFKDELVSFKLETISADLRQEFIKILLRVLYGKMITKGAQRNVTPQARKALILRFLGQCSTDEILWFLKMAFGKYDKYTNEAEPVEAIPVMVRTDFDIAAVWSPKKLRSIVNLLDLIRKEFGGLMETNFHLYMLKLLAFVGSVCNEVALADTSQMHSKMPLVFKNIKNAAFLSFLNFFTHIDRFEWEPRQIGCFTELFVWPTIERLPQDSMQSPTTLLKLLLQWGEQPKHFCYLNQVRNETGPVVFHYVIELLLNQKAKPMVRKSIMGLIEKLLVAAAEKQELPEAHFNPMEVIGPFVPQILQRLKTNFSSRSARQGLDRRDLNILSLLTTHVQDTETCDSLLQLLLPILVAKSQTNASEEVACQIIATLSNLIKRLEEPELYLLKIAPLFEQVQEVTARKMLCQLLVDIAKIRQKQAKSGSAVSPDLCLRLKDTARLVLLLNAWDKRWVEQPDYEKRLDALKEVTQQLEAGTVHMDLGVLIIYNCFYFLKYDKDMGLRDNAAEHLKLLLPKLVQKYASDKKQLDYLVGDVFINLVRRIIRDTNEHVRNEAVRLLGEMVRQCPEAHEILMDLAALGDKQDVEVDFFENMTHLQSHRHGRALLKFCTNAESLTKPPNVRTLTQFILPLASRYLLQEKHAGKHTLIDSAIETVGVVCQLLPWAQYHSILRYYLLKMRTTHEHQKQCVRIVVRILDAFHFDLSQVKTEQQTIQQLKDELNATTDNVAKKDSKIVKSETLQEHATEENGEDSELKDEEYLDAELAETVDKCSDEEKDSLQIPQTMELPHVLNTPLLLTPNASKRVLLTITTILIPTLNRSITERSSYDSKHKVNRKRFSIEREEEEILRVPIALALVKLMQKLPKELLDASLPGVFMKVCTFLRSPLKSVRMLTRDILKKIMLTLGSGYLAMLMDHLQMLLTRGFQVHVLSVTVHGVLEALRSQLQAGDIDSCLTNLLEVSLNDIFGDVSAEKEIEKLTSHTPEAKPSAKSYLILHIAARNIQEACMLDLLIPFKDHLARSRSRKITLKIQDCFAKIVAGLVENAYISRESLLIFIYGTVSESITDLLPGAQKRLLSEQDKERMRRARPDCFIIQPAPRRRSDVLNKNVKSNAQANAHILIEFGLEMLHIVLKRKKLFELDDYQPFLNPLLPLLRDSLKSTHIRVVTFTLKCFTSMWNEAYELPALTQYLESVVERLFEILKNFSTFGASKQEDNFQLVKSAFKAIVALLRKCDDYELTAEQMDQLILYVEQELFEGDNPSTAFALLKAIIARRVDTPPVHDIMKRIGDLSIVSHSESVRDEARALLVTYVMEYKLKKRVDQIINFFTAQLCFALPTGRQSAIQFLHIVIQKFPIHVLSKRAEFLYLSLGTRLVNDDEPDCRKAVANCIELLITRLEKVDRQRLFDMTLLFFDAGKKPSVREMAAVLCSRFLNAEKHTFATRLKLILPTMVACLTLSNPNAPGRFVRAPGTLGMDVDVDDIQPQKAVDEDDVFVDEEGVAAAVGRKQRAIDHEIIQMQYCILKMFDYCASDLSSNEDLVNTVDELAYESQKLLAHEHIWVRCNAAKIISQILASFDFALVAQRLNQVPVKEESAAVKFDFIYLNPDYDIKSLVLDLCAQMVPGETPQPMIDEIVKIFLYVATILRDVPLNVLHKDKSSKQMHNGNGNDANAPKINLNWLVRNIRFLINKEVAKASHCTTMRTALFTLIEGLITLLNIDVLEKLAPALLPALVREMSEEDQNVDADLRQLALRVGSRLRKRLGSDLYDKMRAGVQMKLMVRRAERKKTIAQEKVNDPVRAAKRKASMQERKKAAKKQKTSVMRGKAEDVKHKLKKRKRKAEEDIF